MSWSATFLADFTQWDQALRQAETKLGAFEQSTLKTKNSLQKMVSEFDGTKVIQQAGTMAEAVTRAGGAAKLTDAELKKVNATLQEAIQKYQRMGQEAPSSLSSMADAVRKQLGPLDEVGKKTTLWGSALGSVKTIAAGFVAGFTLDRIVSGIGSAVSSTIAWGGAITDLSAKTGVSMTALQRWEYAAKQSGNTLDQVVTASLQLSKRIEEGDREVQEAIAGLGLSMASLQQLRPEDQFNAVAEALAKTSDQGQRASAAMALFGRSGADLLPTLTADMKALGDEAERLGVIVDEQTLQAMDELGDSWQKMKDAGRGLLAEVISPLIPGMNNLATAASNAAKAFREDFWGALAAVNRAAAVGPFGFGIAFAQQFGGAAGGAQTPGRAPVPTVTTSEFFGSQHGLAGENVVAGVFMRDLVPAARESATALRQVAQAAAVLRDVNIRDGSRNGGVSIWQTLPNQVPLSQLLRESVVLGGQNNPWGGVGFLAPGANNPSLSALTRPGFQWGTFGAQALNAVAPLVGNLLPRNQGTQIGGMLGGLGATLGVSLGSIGGALGSVLPGIGTIAGMALGGLLGHLFGPSRGAILGREADQRMDQTRAGLLQQYGSLDAIAATGRAGQELVAGWQHKNVTGERAFNELVRAFEEQNQLLTEQQGLQSQIAGIEAQRTAINDSLVTTWDEIVAIADRYKISLEGLGGTIQQLGTTTTWTSMLNDIQALERAGADVGGILVGMKEEIGALVAESLRLGLEVPANMRPYVQNLFDTGQLLDAQGQAITDISTLRWGAPVETQADIARQAMERLDEAMQNLVDRLDEIIDRLANGLPDAAEQGARGAGGALSGIEPPEFRGGSVESFDTGGLIERTQIAQVHRGELIGPVDFMARALAGAMSRIGTGGARVVQVVLDRRVLAEALVDEMPGALRRAGAF